MSDGIAHSPDTHEEQKLFAAVSPHQGAVFVEDDHKYAKKSEEKQLPQDRTMTLTMTKEMGEELKKDLDRAKRGEQLNAILMDEHHLTPLEVSERYGSGLNQDVPGKSAGLSTDRARELLLEKGPNQLTRVDRKSAVREFLEQLANPLNLILILCGLISLILWILTPTSPTNLYLLAVLVGAAFLNSFVSWAQIRVSVRAVDALTKLVPFTSKAIRDSSLVEVPSETLVVGDVVFVKMGDRVPADIRVVSGSQFKVDNSSLTGESDPQLRVSSVSNKKRPTDGENLAFGGTAVVSGEAYGIIVRTGDDTVLGQIASLTQVKEKPSPLAIEVSRLVRVILIQGLIVAVIFCLVSIWAQAASAITAFSFLIGVWVSVIPQGLPSTMTMLLMIAVRRLVSKKCVVKNLHNIDTLGSVTLLATDKTGTLTQNKMTVVNMYLGGRHYGVQEKPAPGLFTMELPGAQEAVSVCAYCSSAKFDTDPENLKLPILKRKVFGDATETALLKFATLHNPSMVDRVESTTKVFEVPFNSANKWMMSVVEKQHDRGRLVAYLKGAPERVYARCSRIFGADGIEQTTEKDHKDVEEAIKYMSGLGMRVIGIAQRLIFREEEDDFDFTSGSEHYPTSDFSFIGLIGIMDPPKDTVKGAIDLCRSASIKVIMVTGDHPLTAKSIARQVGLITMETRDEVAAQMGIKESEVDPRLYDAVVITGEELESMTNDQWNTVLGKKEIVFARTSPTNKLEIVVRAQSIGHIVAVTGDGVNDSPALKRADIGVAMGISGSDISKEVAGMILLDDDFSTLVAGVQEGRLIFENLKKSLRYTLTHLFPELVTFLLFIAAGYPSLLSSLLLLMIDLGTELFPANSMGFEVPESDLMKKPPRKVVEAPAVMAIKSEEEAEELARVQSFNIQVVTIPEKKFNLWEALKGFFDLRIPGAKPGDENLVDGELLSWSYLEGSTIQTISCLMGSFWVFMDNGIPVSALYDLGTTGALSSAPPSDATINGKYFTADQMQNIWYEAQAAYFMGIVVVQMFDCQITRIRYGWPTMRKLFFNWYGFLGSACSFLYACIFVYAPGAQPVFLTAGLHPKYYLAGIAGGVFLVLYDLARRAVRYHYGFKGYAARIPFLQPERRSDKVQLEVLKIVNGQPRDSDAEDEHIQLAPIP
eukprot:TRINITY_DN1465_c0_g1_i1.p1 TRINITY_DN1465_c0_g1~~TRINITY_DN1465_c0_g1_i1.p1  ORF type:complete len:1157 (-),score=365.21 TRINITY_DN1465_c0_g1_i1:275-3745(-)